MTPRVRTRKTQPLSYREDDSEDEEELEEKLSEDSFEEDESDDAAPSRKRQKTRSQASSARGRSVPSRPAIRTRRQPQLSYAEEVDADESGDGDFDDDVIEVEDAGEGYSSPRAKKPKIVKQETRKAVRSPRKAPPRRQRRRDRSSSLPAPLPARIRRTSAPPNPVTALNFAYCDIRTRPSCDQRSCSICLRQQSPSMDYSTLRNLTNHLLICLISPL